MKPSRLSLPPKRDPRRSTSWFLRPPSRTTINVEVLAQATRRRNAQRTHNDASPCGRRSRARRGRSSTYELARIAETLRKHTRRNKKPERSPARAQTHPLAPASPSRMTMTMMHIIPRGERAQCYRTTAASCTLRCRPRSLLRGDPSAARTSQPSLVLAEPADAVVTSFRNAMIG